MAKRSYPLELLLTAHGPVELLNSNEETIWSSDADDDFREEFNNEFLNEEDIPEILEYLEENDILSQREADHFVNQEWEFNIETIDQDDDGEEDSDEEEDADIDEDD